MGPKEGITQQKLENSDIVDLAKQFAFTVNGTGTINEYASYSTIMGNTSFRAYDDCGEAYKYCTVLNAVERNRLFPDKFPLQEITTDQESRVAVSLLPNNIQGVSLSLPDHHPLRQLEAINEQHIKRVVISLRQIAEKIRP